MTVDVFMVVFGNFFYEITHIAMCREGFSTFDTLKFILRGLGPIKQTKKPS